jgi:hypothetical protein
MRFSRGEGRCRLRDGAMRQQGLAVKARTGVVRVRPLLTVVRVQSEVRLRKGRRERRLNGAKQAGRRRRVVIRRRELATRPNPQREWWRRSHGRRTTCSGSAGGSRLVTGMGLGPGRRVRQPRRRRELRREEVVDRRRRPEGLRGWVVSRTGDERAACAMAVEIGVSVAQER